VWKKDKIFVVNIPLIVMQLEAKHDGRRKKVISRSLEIQDLRFKSFKEESKERELTNNKWLIIIIYFMLQ